MPSECDPEAREVEEGVINGEQMLVTNQQSSKLPEPSISSFHDPSALVAAQLSAIFIAPQFVVLPIRRNQFDTSVLESLAQWVGVVAAVGYDALRLLPRTAARPGNSSYNPVTSSPVTQTVSPITPTLTVSSSLNPSPLGAGVTSRQPSPMDSRVRSLFIMAARRSAQDPLAARRRRSPQAVCPRATIRLPHPGRGMATSARSLPARLPKQSTNPSLH